MAETSVAQTSLPFDKPGAIARGLNSVVLAFVRLGIGFPHMRVLEVRGRKSGKLFTLPVDLLAKDNKLYLVAPRGHTQWARNTQAAGSVVLRRAGQAQTYRARALDDAEKPPILQAYLDSFRREVQRFFPVPAGSAVEKFVPLAARYPAFELTLLSPD